MKKLILGIAACATLSFSALCQADSSPVQKTMTTFPELVLQQGYLPNVGISKPNADATTQASAPGISGVYIFAVGSTKFNGYEYISPNQVSTIYDHGGAELVVAVLEFGYGRAYANFLGSQLESYRNYRTDNICGTLSHAVFCSTLPPGATIIGFLRYWDLSRDATNEGGNFSETAISINGPTSGTASIIIQ